jgi:hypothetical protein
VVSDENQKIKRKQKITYTGYLKKFSFWWQEHEIHNFELVLEIKLGPVASISWQLDRRLLVN